MGQISVEIAGRTYPLACRDGEEAHLGRLAEHIRAKADQLNGTLGAMSELRLLLMAGILIADELFEERRAPAVEAVARRLERLATVLEAAAPE